MGNERHRWVLYTDETMIRNMERIRTEIAKKDGVDAESITNRRVVAEVLNEKFVEYADKQNNRARITTLVENVEKLDDGQTELKSEVADLKLEVTALRFQVGQLTMAVLGMKGGAS